MQDLENNDLIILDTLGNIYTIYANLALVSLLNLNHFWITQAELCLKGTIVNVSFMFAITFLDIYENPMGKNFINLSCPKHPKVINWNKKWHKLFFSHFFMVPQKGFIFLINQKVVWKENIYLIFPLYSELGRERLRLCFCRTQNLCQFHFLNNRDT